MTRYWCARRRDLVNTKTNQTNRKTLNEADYVLLAAVAMGLVKKDWQRIPGTEEIRWVYTIDDCDVTLRHEWLENAGYIEIGVIK